MKKIGFIDYYLSEWHANNYPLWIKETAADFEVAFAWAEKDISPVDGVSTDEWCAKMGVTKCDTIAEVCKMSDAVIILAPSNPEKHLSYAKEVLPYKKPTYIDKTFAPDYETAKEIFDIASVCDTKFFSSSALRYADELSSFKNADALILTGGGRDFNEYIIHLVEMAVILLNDPVKRVKVESQKAQRICRVETENGKMATLILAYGSDYTITGMTDSGKNRMITVKSDFFKKLIADMLRFFETNQVSFNTAQTLEVMKFRDALLKAEKTDGCWKEVSVTADICSG